MDFENESKLLDPEFQAILISDPLKLDPLRSDAFFETR